MQTRKQALIETAVSTLVAFALSVLIGLYLYPLFGHRFSVLDNITLTAIFTVWSFVRSYWMRRFFNWFFHREQVCKKSPPSL